LYRKSVREFSLTDFLFEGQKNPIFHLTDFLFEGQKNPIFHLTDFLFEGQKNPIFHLTDFFYNFMLSNVLIMKNIYTIIIFFLAGFSATSQIINFPDANLKAMLLAADITNTIAKDSNGDAIRIDSNNNAEIEESEALAVAQLELYRYPYDPAFSIHSIEGVQYFTNIIKLSCPANDIASLPAMDNLVNLTYFDCAGNDLAQIQQVENLVNLEILVVSHNPITSVNLSNLTNLYAFSCRGTLLSCIDLTGTNVYNMWCDQNPNLVNIILQNGVLTNTVPRLSPTIPPPLPYFNFLENPNLEQICYDNGEYDAVVQGFFGNIDPAVSITANCLAYDCTALGIANNEVSAFSLFPNPASDQLNISLSDTGTLKSVAVYNMIGQRVIAAGDQATIDVSILANGAYFVTVETDKGKSTQKLIKQ
jgi:hypothetical protein